MEEYVNVFYFENIKRVGGVENSLYQLAKKYHKDYDITIMYKTCDPYQLMRLQKYVRCIKWDGQEVKCKKCFYGYHYGIISSVTADEHILVVHTDYKAQWDLGIKRQGNLPNHPKLTKYICVSDVAKKGFEEIMGKHAERCYNVYEPKELEKVWHFVTWGRIDRQKGEEQYAKFIQIADSIPNFKYDFTIISDGCVPIKSKNIIELPPRLDVLDYVAGRYDAGVFFSQHESFGYSPLECLSLGIPVIASDLPAYREIGINSKNGFLIKKDFSNFDLKEITDKLKKGMKFEYTPPKDDWDKFLIKSKPTYVNEGGNFIMVRAVSRYKDLEWNEYKEIGDEYPVSRDRLPRLLGENEKKIVRVEIINEKEYDTIRKRIAKEVDTTSRGFTWMQKFRTSKTNTNKSE